MDNLIQKKFGTSPIRIVNQDGEVWFIAKDVCDALGLTNSRVALKALNKKEVDVTFSYSNSETINKIRRREQMQVISESGLYKLVMRSNKPNAKKFQDWVAGDVLPEIRRTGGYRIRATDTGYKIGNDMWHNYREWAMEQGFSTRSNALGKRRQQMPQHFTIVDGERMISGYYAGYLEKCKELREELKKEKLELLAFERYRQLEFQFLEK